MAVTMMLLDVAQRPKVWHATSPFVSLLSHIHAPCDTTQPPGAPKKSTRPKGAASASGRTASGRAVGGSRAARGGGGGSSENSSAAANRRAPAAGGVKRNSKAEGGREGMHGLVGLCYSRQLVCVCVWDSCLEGEAGGCQR